jgi:hypothetical protein
MTRNEWKHAYRLGRKAVHKARGVALAPEVQSCLTARERPLLVEAYELRPPYRPGDRASR